MAFSTIPGSAGAPDSYVGTSGVDSITITNGSARAYLTAAAAADFISYNTTFLEPNVLTGAQLYGGQGADTFADLGSGNNNANFVLLTASSIYGNKDADTIGTPGGGITAVTSSVYGGQGNDSINLNNVSSSVVNGNKDADTIVTNGTLYSNASIYGGQGADVVTLSGTGNDNFTNTLISLDNDNDSFSVGAAVVSFTTSSVLGGQGNDTINATNAGVSFIIDGGADNDALTGDTAADSITGGAGNDTITAAAGNDSVTAGAGIDIIVGGAGTGTAASAGTINVSVTFGTGVDRVTSFDSTDVYDLATNDATAVVDARAAAIAAAGDAFFITGTYTAATGVFNYAAAGTDVYVGIANAAAAANSVVAATTSTNGAVILGAGGFFAGTNVVA